MRKLLSIMALFIAGSVLAQTEEHYRAMRDKNFNRSLYCIGGYAGASLFKKSFGVKRFMDIGPNGYLKEYSDIRPGVIGSARIVKLACAVGCLGFGSLGLYNWYQAHRLVAKKQ